MTLMFAELVPDMSLSDPLPLADENKKKKQELPDNGSFPSKSMSDYDTMLARPVFFKTRSPYVPPPPSVPSKPAPAPQAPFVDPGLSLTGVIVNKQLRKAYVIAKGDTQGKWLAEGDSIVGWAVQAITPTSVTLKQSDRSIELNLYPKP